MRICGIRDGIVVSILELPDGYVIAPDRKSASGKARAEVQSDEGSELVEYNASYGAPNDMILVASDEAALGWTWSAGTGFVEPEPLTQEPRLLPITRRQLRLTLLAHGHLGAVEPAIEALDEPERSVAIIEWQDASEYRRDHALIAQVGTALGLDDADIDAMWLEAMGR